MALYLAYLNNYKADLLQDLIYKSMDDVKLKAEFYETRGKIASIDDILNFEEFITNAKLKT